MSNNCISKYLSFVQVRSLEMLSESWPDFEDPWKDIGYETINCALKSSNSSEVIPMLSLMNSLIGRIDCKDWQTVWPNLEKLWRHPNKKCRHLVAQVFRKAYDSIDGRSDPRLVKVILSACNDQDQDIRDAMLTFLGEKLPESARDRTLQFICHFYTPETEPMFLPIFTYLVLQLVSKNHAYSDAIYQEPLDQVVFQDMDWTRTLSTTMRSASFKNTQSRYRVLQVLMLEVCIGNFLEC